MSSFRPTIANRLTDILAGRIVSGQLPDRTTTDELMQEYCVSRTTMREALCRLADRNLLTLRPGSGVNVLPRDRWNLLDADVLRWLAPYEPDLPGEARAVADALDGLKGPLASAISILLDPVLP